MAFLQNRYFKRYIATSGEIVSNKILGVSGIGTLVYVVDTKKWYVVGDTLGNLYEYKFPLGLWY